MFQRSAILAVRKLSNVPVFAQSMRKFSAEVETGVVKYFNAPKGFGFISRDAKNGVEPVPADAFAHFTNVTLPEGQSNGFRTLYQGQTVTFELELGPKGAVAKNIVATSPAPPRPQGQTYRPRDDSI